MNTTPTTTHLPRRGQALALLALMAALTGLAALPDPTQARERQTSVTGSGGKTATRNVARQGGDVNSSTTLPSGKTTSRSVDRSAGGTTATVTGPIGQTVTRSTTVTP